MQKAAAPDVATKLLTENQAAQDMWVYYRDHKALIHSDVRGFRGVILAELMQGVAVEKVFARFSLDPEPAKPVRRAR